MATMEVERAAETSRDAGFALGFTNAEPPEVPTPVRLEVEGRLPAELRGTLFRQGPGRLDVHGVRQRHWFDGDGLATAVRFDDGGATYVSRFVATPEKEAEDRQHRRIFGVFGGRPSGGPLARALRHDLKNVANTNLVPHRQAVWALYEGGRPYRLDPASLATLGIESFGGVLSSRHRLSAHPHRDPVTGDLWNFGLSPGGPRTMRLSIYRHSARGGFERMRVLEIPLRLLVHDFALTRRHLVFALSPVVIPLPSLMLLLAGQRSFAESLCFRPREKTLVLVVDRERSTATWHRTDAFMCFHVANAWDEGDEIVVDLCTYDGIGIIAALSEVLDGQVRTRSVSQLERLRIGKDGVSRERLCETSLEFPRVVEEGGLAPRRRYFGASWADRDWIGVPAAIDLETGAARLAPLGRHEWAGEPVPVRKRGGTLDDAWLLVTVLDTRRETTEVRVLDGADLSAPPVARLRLPQRLPFMLHGNWKPAIPSPQASG